MKCLYRVLSIDDSKSVHAFLDKCIRDTNNDEFFFLHVYGVKEGLELLKENNEISLVLLDWEMPEISGAEGLPILREKFPGVPVIMLTSKNDPTDISSMLNKGASDYIMKPIMADILFEKLRSIKSEYKKCCQT